MRINEIFGNTHWYECRVRVVGDGLNVTVTTVVNGNTRTGVLAILMKIFGRNNVLSCNEINSVLNEKSFGAPNTAVGPLSADQLRLKALQDQKRQLAQREKQERARQQLVKAQAQVVKSRQVRPAGLGASA